MASRPKFTIGQLVKFTNARVGVIVNVGNANGATPYASFKVTQPGKLRLRNVQVRYVRYSRLQRCWLANIPLQW